MHAHERVGGGIVKMTYFSRSLYSFEYLNSRYLIHLPYSSTPPRDEPIMGSTKDISMPIIQTSMPRRDYIDLVSTPICPNPKAMSRSRVYNSSSREKDHSSTDKYHGILYYHYSPSSFAMHAVYPCTWATSCPRCGSLRTTTLSQRRHARRSTCS